MRTAVAAKKGPVRRCSILGQQIMSSAQVVPALLDVVDQAAHAAQPGLVGVAADIYRLDVHGLVRRCVAHLDIDIEDQAAHLLHPAACDALGTGRAAALEHAIHAAAACGMLPKESAVAPPRVALADVRRLVVERADLIDGRCRYVADLGARRVPQPILFARRGESFDGVIENALPQPTTVHFHGLTLPEAADGAGFDPIEPGARKRVRFEVKNRSGLYWFHPHPHGFTGEQVYAGLTGLLVVTDEDDDALDAALALAPENRLALAIAEAPVLGGAGPPLPPRGGGLLHRRAPHRATGTPRASVMRRSRPGRFVKAPPVMARRVDWPMAPSWRFFRCASTVLRCARRRCPRGSRRCRSPPRGPRRRRGACGSTSTSARGF